MIENMSQNIQRAQTVYEETKRPMEGDKNMKQNRVNPYDDGEKTPQPRQGEIQKAKTQPINPYMENKEGATPVPGQNYNNFDDFQNLMQRQQEEYKKQENQVKGIDLNQHQGNSNVSTESNSNSTGRVKIVQQKLEEKKIIDDEPEDDIFFDDEFLDQKPKEIVQAPQKPSLNQSPQGLTFLLKSRLGENALINKKSLIYSQIRKELYDKNEYSNDQYDEYDLDVYDQEANEEEIDYQNEDYWDVINTKVVGFSHNDPMKKSQFLLQNRVLQKKVENLNDKLRQINQNSMPKDKDCLMFQPKNLFIECDQLQQKFLESENYNNKLKIDEWVKETLNISKELTIDFEKDDKNKQKLSFRREIQKNMPLFQRIKKSMASMIKDNGETSRYGHFDKENKYQSYVFQEDFYFYAATNNLAKLSKAIQNDPSILNKKNEFDITIMYLASKFGLLDLVQYMVQKQADINLQSLQGSTSLHAATYYGHKKIIEFLLLNNADQMKKNIHKRTAYEETKDFKYVFENFNNAHSPVLFEIKKLISQRYFSFGQKLYITDSTGKELEQGYFCKINYEINQKQRFKLLNFQNSKEQFEKAYYITSNDKIQEVLSDGIQSQNNNNQLYQFQDGVYLQTSVTEALSNPEVQSLEDDQKENYMCLIQVIVQRNNLTWDSTKAYYDCKVNNAEDILISGVFYLNKKVFDLIRMNNISNIGLIGPGKCLLQHQLEPPKQICGICDICGQNSMNFSACYKESCQFFKCNQCITSGRILP